MAIPLANYGYSTAASMTALSNSSYNQNSEGYSSVDNPYYSYNNMELRNSNMHRYDHGFHVPPHQDPMRQSFSTKHESPIVHQYPHMLYQYSSWHEFDNGINFDGARSSKHKRPRMSLQKRLLVNARERERMRVLNKAFESLRDALPCYIADGHMAKITTLRLAINYIRALSDLLVENKTNIEKTERGIIDKEKEEYK